MNLRDLIDELWTVDRLFLIGNSGVGKTTLANQLIEAAGPLNVEHIRAGGWIAEQYPQASREELTEFNRQERERDPDVAIKWLKRKISELGRPVIVDGVRSVHDLRALVIPRSLVVHVTRSGINPLGSWERIGITEILAEFDATEYNLDALQ